MSRDISNFLADILAEAEEETIECVVFTEAAIQDYSDIDTRNIPEELVGKPLTLEEATPLLDYKYDAGYGGKDCHYVNVWTATRVFYIEEYDGSTVVTWQPRNPPTRESDQK